MRTAKPSWRSASAHKAPSLGEGYLLSFYRTQQVSFHLFIHAPQVLTERLLYAPAAGCSVGFESQISPESKLRPFCFLYLDSACTYRLTPHTLWPPHQPPFSSAPYHPLILQLELGSGIPSLTHPFPEGPLFHAFLALFILSAYHVWLISLAWL